MSNIMKRAKFDYQLLKPYTKSILFTMVVPVAFVVLNRSLLTAVSFAMCTIAMSASYPFAIEEKSGMERLYGFLPVSKTDLVIGRYLTSACVGLVALCFSILVDSAVLLSLGESVEITELMMIFIYGAVMHSLYIGFQIPGYYQFGSIKGKSLMFIPVIGFLVMNFLSDKFDMSLIAQLLSQPILLGVMVLGIITLLYACSILTSITIVKNKVK